MGPTPRRSGGLNENRASELARTLCEEHRLSHGARRPGDPCVDEFDCLPYPESTTAEGEAWSHIMTCVDGECREQPASIPADYDAPCTPDVGVATNISVGSGVVTRGSCENAQCSITPFTGLARCTMQCELDADCPAGSLCRSQAIGPIANIYDFGSGWFCTPRCQDTGTCEAASETKKGGVAFPAPSDPTG
jgi:hypothetical protein